MHENQFPSREQQKAAAQKEYVDRVQKDAGYGPFGASCGPFIHAAELPIILGSLKNETQPYPQHQSVRGLLNIARGQVADLEKEITLLGEQLLPVRELSQTQEGDKGHGALGTPEVIGMLRGLIDRIARQQAVVRAIAGELRI
jgi:hypothetical protein